MEYDAHSEWRRIGAVDKADNVVRLCGKIPHESIIEIGCGEGAVLAELSSRKFGAVLSGLEVSECGVGLTLRKGIPNLSECRVYDGYNTGYPNNAFDLAILSHVIEHVEEPRRLLREAARIGRSVFVEVPCEDTLRLARDFVPDAVGHINAFSPVTIRRFVQTCGLTVCDQVVTDHSYDPYRFRYRRRALIYLLPRRTALRLVPSIAPRIFVYHTALLVMADRTKSDEDKDRS